MPFDPNDENALLNPQQTIVIIDDEFTTRTILRETVLGICDSIVVESFSNPISALEWLSSNEPDLVLLDYKMKEMSGYELLCALKGITHLEDIPVVVVTAETNKDIRYQMLGHGATDFINKPIDHHECLIRCRNLLMLRGHQKATRNRAKTLEASVKEATKNILAREHETLLRLAKAGEFRDTETGNHVIRMAKYSRFIAEALGLDEERCALIEVSAPMHDIGKIGISDGILLKPGKLTDVEFSTMKQHTTIGHEILKGSPSKFLALGAEIALGHHEKFDGTGYPSGLKGSEIPLEARIVAVADVFDALTSERPYKKAWTNQAAIDYITEQSGKHFDPECVAAFKAQMGKVIFVQKQFNDPVEQIPLGLKKVVA
ncbi:MAG TPA: response regulator [Methylotenera sp.]|nr:response regulator [Methylotenera sp.]